MLCSVRQKKKKIQQDKGNQKYWENGEARLQYQIRWPDTYISKGYWEVKFEQRLDDYEDVSQVDLFEIGEFHVERGKNLPNVCKATQAGGFAKGRVRRQLIWNEAKVVIWQGFYKLIRCHLEDIGFR